MESLLDSTFRFLDKETDVELEISKLISEQERTNGQKFQIMMK